MGYHSPTPFGRTADAVRAAPCASPPPDRAPCPADKWQILRDLTAARARFGLSDRDMTVLQALLSCHPGQKLDGTGPLIVHPSNETICARANGMPCSTMRRHLAKLVSAGFLTRHDSPNGKRYVRRIAGIRLAFGFDLRPLLLRAEEIAGAAEARRREDAEHAALRERVSLLRRDLATLLDACPETADPAATAAVRELVTATTRGLRRRLDRETLLRMERDLRQAVDRTMAMQDRVASNPSTSDAQNEHHQQRSPEESLDPLSPSEDVRSTRTGASTVRCDEKTSTSLPFHLVLQTCTEIALFAPDPIDDWRSLVRASERIRPMTGISDSLWNEAKKVLGYQQAATVLCAILQRFSEIRNPGGYLRDVLAQAARGTFSALRMLQTLPSFQGGSSQL